MPNPQIDEQKVDYNDPITMGNRILDIERNKKEQMKLLQTIYETIKKEDEELSVLKDTFKTTLNALLHEQK